jgi:hypothetical protein
MASTVTAWGKHATIFISHETCHHILSKGASLWPSPAITQLSQHRQSTPKTHPYTTRANTIVIAVIIMATMMMMMMK